MKYFLSLLLIIATQASGQSMYQGTGIKDTVKVVLLITPSEEGGMGQSVIAYAVRERMVHLYKYDKIPPYPDYWSILHFIDKFKRNRIPERWVVWDYQLRETDSSIVKPTQ